MNTALRLSICLLLLAALASAGCGQKGKLYRPGEPDEQTQESP